MWDRVGQCGTEWVYVEQSGLMWYRDGIYGTRWAYVRVCRTDGWIYLWGWVAKLLTSDGGYGWMYVEWVGL